MKKCLLILLATMAFVACNDDELDMEYYSQLSPEELITSGEGVEYLVRAHGEVDSELLNHLLQSHTASQVGRYFYGDDGWYWPRLYGDGAFPHLIVFDESTIRYCFESTAFGKTLLDGTLVIRFYQEYKYSGDPLLPLVSALSPSARIVAHLEKIFVLQDVLPNGDPCRLVFKMVDNRDEILNEYRYDINDTSLYK